MKDSIINMIIIRFIDSKYIQRIIRPSIAAILIGLCSLDGQDFKLRTYQVSTTQQSISSDSLVLMGTIGSSLYQNSSSDSLQLKGGMTHILTNLFKSPPLLTTFISDTIKKDGMPVIIRAIATDLNGINGSNLFIQPGGGQPFVFPMVALDDSTFEASVPESLLTVRNFRAWVVSVDGMYYETTSQYNTPSMEFSVSELSMSNTFSHYPDGIESERWRMMSWPGVLDDNALATSSLDKGHVFYDWDISTDHWTKPETIEPGKAYWFKHKYSNNTSFSNSKSAGTAVPLVDYEIELNEGWNIIGSPFSFPVEMQYDARDISGLYLFGKDSKDGWQQPQERMSPWAGYAVHAKTDGQSIILNPFPANNEQEAAGRIAENGWSIHLHVYGEYFFDHSNVIGRLDDAMDYEDGYDIPSLPNLDHFIKLNMDLNNNSNFNFSSDIRSIDEFNGVWNLRLNGKGHLNPVIVSANVGSSLPEGLVVQVVDIPNRMVYDQFLVNGIIIDDKLTESYDMKLVAGDQQYVEETVLKILSEIPEEFSLSQNYPNPFNPLTKIDFSLPKTGRVVITIYNLLGQEVTTLVNQRLDYGYHTVTWRGTDGAGRPVSSGVYFSELRTRGFRQTKKMLLLK
jgi:hypothetical protein